MSNYGNYNQVYDLNENEKEIFYTQSVYDLVNKNNVMEQFNHYLNEYDVVVLKIWATWCQPCKKASERLNELIKYIFEKYPLLFQNKQRIKFLDEDIDNENSIHKDKINAIPNFFIYSSVNGQNSVQSFTNVDFDQFEQLLLSLCNYLEQQYQEKVQELNQNEMKQHLNVNYY